MNLYSYSTFTVNSKLEFASPQSYYKIQLNDSAKHTFTYWNEKCKGKWFPFTLSLSLRKLEIVYCEPMSNLYFKDLGNGWAPAVLDSEKELNFIRGGQERNRELGSYFIGGSTDAKEGKTLNYADIYTNRSGNHTVWQVPFIIRLSWKEKHLMLRGFSYENHSGCS